MINDWSASIGTVCAKCGKDAKHALVFNELKGSPRVCTLCIAGFFGIANIKPDEIQWSARIRQELGRMEKE